MSWYTADRTLSAKNIGEYILALEKRIEELVKANSKLAYDNQILKQAIEIIKDVDLSKIKDINQY